MRSVVLAATAASILAGCSTMGTSSPWYADRYYRDDARYTERVLSPSDRVYVGQDGRYYCRRSDGSTGLIVGGLAGGVLGGLIAPGGSQTLGAILGAGAGALAGREIDRSNVRCR